MPSKGLFDDAAQLQLEERLWPKACTVCKSDLSTQVSGQSGPRVRFSFRHCVRRTCAHLQQQSKRNNSAAVHQRTNAHKKTSRSASLVFGGRAKPSGTKFQKALKVVASTRGLQQAKPARGCRLGRAPGRARSPPCSRDASWESFGQAVRSLHCITTCMTCVMCSGVGQRSWPSTQGRASARKLQHILLLQGASRDVPVKQKHNSSLNLDERQGKNLRSPYAVDVMEVYGLLCLHLEGLEDGRVDELMISSLGWIGSGLGSERGPGIAMKGRSLTRSLHP